MSPAGWAVVCDFDGTATVEDLADALSIEWIGRERWQRAGDAFQAGALSFEQLLREIFEPIAASAEEIRAFARARVRFRSGLPELLATCRDRGVPFLLASGGLDLYVQAALELLPAGALEGVEVRANRAEPAGGHLRLSFPWRDAPGACGRCGSCKGAMVREIQGRGRRVIAVGDGNADRCMAGVAEVLFARGRLAAWCDREGVPYRPFETLHEVAAAVEEKAPLTRG